MGIRAGAHRLGGAAATRGGSGAETALSAPAALATRLAADQPAQAKSGDGVSSRLPGDAESPTRPPRSAGLGVHAPAPAPSFAKSSGPLLCVTRGAVGRARGGEPWGGARGAVRPGRMARRGPGRERGAARALWGWPLSTGFIWREAEHRRLSCSVRCCGWAGCARAAMLLWRAGDVCTATLHRVPRAEHHCGAWVTGLSRGPFAGKRQAGSRRGNKDAASRTI